MCSYLCVAVPFLSGRLALPLWREGLSYLGQVMAASSGLHGQTLTSWNRDGAARTVLKHLCT